MRYPDLFLTKCFEGMDKMPKNFNSENRKDLFVARHQVLSILVITPFETPSWTWLSKYFSIKKFSWKFLNGNLFGKNKLFWALHAWKATRQASVNDLIISHHPYMTLWVAAALRIRGSKKPHIAFSFNHGNRAFFVGLLLWLAKRVLSDVALFNVLSAGERILFNHKYKIPMTKIRFSHWAVQPVKVENQISEEYKSFQPYITSMGRNNRDFDTLLKATETLKINVIIVCSKRDSEKLLLRPNVKVKTDISLQESMEILNGSLFSVVPLTDNSTGAGHMTFVHAMHLGKSQIATDVKNTQDYFVDDVHGLRVPPKDVGAMRDAIQRLIDEPKTRTRFGVAAQNFAEQWLSEQAGARSAREVIEGWAKGERWKLEPEGWSAQLKALGVTP